MFESKEPVFVYGGYPISISADGKRIAMYRRSHSLSIRDCATGDELRRLNALQSNGFAFMKGHSFSPDGRYIVALSPYKARIWDLDSGAEPVEFEHGDSIENSRQQPAIAFSPDGTRIILSAAGETIGIWDTATGDKLLTLDASSKVYALAFSTTGEEVLAGCESGIRVWDSTGGNDGTEFDYWYHRGLDHLSNRENHQAISNLTRANEISPVHSVVWYWRAIAYYREKEYDKSILDLDKATQMAPYHSNYWYMKGLAYWRTNDPSQAISNASRAIKIEPEHTPNSLWLRGLAYYKTKHYKLAISDLTKAIDRRSDSEEMNNSLAWWLATCSLDELRSGPRAVELATKACEKTAWENSLYLNTLAAACAEAGDFEAAVKWQEKAIVLITETNLATHETDFKSRLELYKSGRPYREEPRSDD
jgi:tetratricopeptide (TPR) repeat protein